MVWHLLLVDCLEFIEVEFRVKGSADPASNAGASFEEKLLEDHQKEEEE